MMRIWSSREHGEKGTDVNCFLPDKGQLEREMELLPAGSIEDSARV